MAIVEKFCLKLFLILLFAISELLLCLFIAASIKFELISLLSIYFRDGKHGVSKLKCTSVRVGYC